MLGYSKTILNSRTLKNNRCTFFGKKVFFSFGVICDFDLPGYVEKIHFLKEIFSFNILGTGMEPLNSIDLKIENRKFFIFCQKNILPELKGIIYE